MDTSTLRELGIGISALIVLAFVVKIFLKSMKETRDDFSKLIGNHIDHNTKAIENLDKTLEKNTEVLIKISGQLEK